MQSSRIRSNNTTTQSFTNAELDFAFYRSPPPGVSNLRYPKLKLSTNEAQPVAFCLSSKTPPNAPQEPRLSWEVELRASTTIAPEGSAAENHPAARVLSWSFGIMELLNVLEEFGAQAVALLSSSFSTLNDPNPHNLWRKWSLENMLHRFTR